MLLAYSLMILKHESRKSRYVVETGVKVEGIVDDPVGLRLVFLELICSVRGTVVIRSEGGEITKGT